MTRAAHLAAVKELEAAATGLIFDAMADVLASVSRHLAMTAAAVASDPDEPIPAAAPSAEPLLSIDDVGRLPVEWTAEVDGRLLPWYADVFDAGSDAAAEQVTELRTPADLLPEIADDVADDVPTEILDEADLDDVGLGDVVDEVPDLRGPIVIETGGDPLFMNEASTRHLASARNRFLSVGDQTWANARQALLEGMANGDGTDALQRRLRSVVDIGRHEAAAVARTEVISAANAGSTARIRSMGADAPQFKQWLSTLDSRCRPTHVAADGQVVPLAGKFTVGEAQLDYPGDPDGPDREVIQCRCTLLYVDEAEPLDVVGRGQGGLTDEQLEAARLAVADQRDAMVKRADHMRRDVFGRQIVEQRPAADMLTLEAWRSAGVGPGDPCGFDDCGHPLHWHPRRGEGAATLWPCIVAGCGCSDFAQPGSVEELAAAAVPAPQQVDTTTGEVHTCSMLALVPTEADAERLAGLGEPPEALHLTLAYLGEAADIPEAVQAALLSYADEVATQLLVAPAEAFGAAVWNPRGDDPSLVLSIGGAGLAEMHEVAASMVASAALAGAEPDGDGMVDVWEPPENHRPWVAHVCLAYADDPGALLDEALARVGPLMFDRLRLTFGGEAHDFPLVDPGVVVSGEGIAARNDVHDKGTGKFAKHSGGGGAPGPAGAGGAAAAPATFGEGRNFDKGAADEFGEGGWSEWRSSATPGQRKAVRAYTDSGYSQRMNDRLRGVEASPADRRKMDTTDKYVGDMTSAFDAPGAVTPSAVKVHRVMQGPIAEAIIKRHRAKTLTPAGEGFKGTHFRDKGFISTSTNRDIANKSSAAKNKRVTMEIDVPKGQRAIAPGSLSRFDVENEIILPPGTRFEVKEAGYRQGVLNIKVVIADD